MYSAFIIPDKFVKIYIYNFAQNILD